MRKKLLALLVAMTMTMGMSTVAFAEPSTSSFDLDTTKTNETHAYELYQLLTGTYNDNTKSLGDIELGASMNSYKGTAQDIADMFEGKSEAEAQEAAAALTGLKAVDSNDKGDFSGLVPGYYLIKDVTDGTSLKQDSIYEPVLFLAPRDTKSNSKVDTVSVEKKTEDINDSTGLKEEEVDSADYDLGDKIPFQYTSKVPTNADKYVNGYTFIFHDKMSAGLTFNNDIKVTVNGVAYEVTTNAPGTDDATFDVVVAGLEGYPGATVVVTYSATLNGDAVMGSAGNSNEVILEFTNDPQGEGTGMTVPDINIIFTYGITVNKTDEGGDPLEGAAFALYKYTNSDVAITRDNAKTLTDGWEVVADFTDTVKGEETTFAFNHIDDGFYKLVETKTPAGYNTIDDQYFVVEASHKDGEAPSLTNLEGTAIDGTIELTADKTNGTLKTDIVNQTGALLPSTGGIGTTIFYIIGCILVVGGGAMLFVKKKMGQEEA